MIASKPTPRHFHHSRSNQKGQTLVEYALILSIISVLAIATMLNVTGQTKVAYSGINSQLNNAQLGGQTGPAHP